MNSTSNARRSLAASLTLAMVAGLATLAAAEGDPNGDRNRAPASHLPHGEGFASRFAQDTDIAQHPAVIFCDDFETRSYAEHWDEVRDSGQVLSLERLEPAQYPTASRYLRVTAELGKNTGGGLTKWFSSHEVIFIRFYCRFGSDCDYIHHFCTLRANRGLTGGDAWSGFGGAGVKPRGDERFSTALEPWGNWGQHAPPGKWNFYSYWHEMAASPDKKYWGNAFRPANQPLIERGRWICAEFMLKHNTPGEADGEQAYWIDGELRGHWTGINWRKSPDLWANAFTLESYVTDSWTKQKTNIVDFDNVVIAKEYIGPAGK